MARVELAGVRKRYGDTQVLDRIDLDVADGEYVVLLGRSGCGKSTLLRCVAGLEEITEGELRIGGRRVNEIAPKDRDVAMVFQSYALYPHMSVRENMAFALNIRGTPQKEIDAAVGAAADMLELGPLLDRKPSQLSGGQRQRVAMGRAIVRRPAVFLFDEPLSNLDAGLRAHMRVELKRLHRKLGATILHVTHDQVEAMTLGDRLVLLDKGVAQQIGTPHELYHKPKSTFVAQFLGTPTMNLLPAHGSRDTCWLDGLDVPLPIPGSGAVWIGVRPTDVRVGEGPVPARVDVVEALGDEGILHLEILTAKAPIPLVARVADPGPFRPGSEVRVGFATAHVFDKASGDRLSPPATP